MSPQLVTSDNEVFTVDWDVCTRIGIISSPDVPNEPIPLPNVSSSVLKKVLEYCEHHRTEPLPSLDDEPESDDPRRKRSLEPDEWDRDFIKVDQELLFEIISAANYLDIKPLCDLGCRQVADMIKGKTTAQIRQMFNIAQIRKENEWAEDR